MVIRTSFVVIGFAVAITLIGAFRLLQLNAEEPAPVAAPTPTRFSVSTAVLPGHLSMTLLYITDADSNRLYIYRAFGGMDTSFKGDPELYRTFDLTSVGGKNLRQAK